MKLMNAFRGAVLGLMLLPLMAFAQDALVTKNHDILSLATSIDQINQEINNAASTNIAGVTTADLTRWTAYVEALRSYAAWVVAEPGNPLDFPKTSTLVMDVPPMPEMTTTQNRTADDLVRLLGLERTELVLSQSSGLSSGLISYDYNRLISVLEKCDSRIALASTQSPIDAPWTLPQISGSASVESRGVNLP